MPDAEKTWGRIRATRANPPTPAKSTPERRRTYGTALEQAQQMFHAAEAVGPETQPLLIFYGLSQAGRAIAAASASSIANGEGWQLRSHGIQANGLDGPLRDIRVVSGKAGKPSSFVRLSEILDSPLLPESAEVRLEDLWDCIPGNNERPLSDDEQHRRMPLFVSQSLHADPHPLLSVRVVDFPPWVVASSQPRQALDDYLSAFPDVHHYTDFLKTSNDPEGDPDFVLRTPGGWGELLMHWLMPSEQSSTVEERLGYLKTMVRPYAGGWWFFPEVGGAGRSVHPLMAWWAVLHALSMLARYQPDQWMAEINVDEDGSRAVAIEQLLWEARTTVPILIAETIEHVAEPNT
ncbi:YaaC family protein [Actinomadura violacea]|uniref:YaaC-like Protein n=1 Tax=Actinomadura violacea TaxID=2819934 RepID=A0ABS3RWN7_9ACTN|nr:hypothetical protein [Actinomadura violacea]MBO2461171.1 hypothetical protein [Actinomadura violacea]